MPKFNYYIRPKAKFRLRNSVRVVAIISFALTLKLDIRCCFHGLFYLPFRPCSDQLWISFVLTKVSQNRFFETNNKHAVESVINLVLGSLYTVFHRHLRVRSPKALNTHTPTCRSNATRAISWFVKLQQKEHWNWWGNHQETKGNLMSFKRVSSVIKRKNL